MPPSRATRRLRAGKARRGCRYLVLSPFRLCPVVLEPSQLAALSIPISQIDFCQVTSDASHGRGARAQPALDPAGAATFARG